MMQFLIVDRLNITSRFFGDSFLYWWKSLTVFQQNLIQKIIESNSNLVGKEYDLAYLDFLFGYKSYKQNNTQFALREAGLSHLLSASGFFIIWFLGLFDRVLSWLRLRSFRIRSCLKLLAIAFYWLLSKSSASLARSLLSVLLGFIVKFMWWRQLDFFRCQILVLLLMWLCDSQQFATPSLQFSLGAVVGIYSLSGILNHLWKQILYSRTSKIGFSLPPQPRHKMSIFMKRAFSKMGEQLIFFICVQFGMLPLIASAWGEMAGSSVIANTILAGVSPALFGLGLVWLGWLGVSQLCLSFWNCSSWLKIPTLVFFWPYRVFGWLAEELSQVTQFSVKLPLFSFMATLAWYSGLLFVRFLYQRFQTAQTIQGVSLEPFAKSLQYSKNNHQY